MKDERVLIQARQFHDALAAARGYLEIGWSPLPVPRGSKTPTLRGWQNLALHEGNLPLHFQGGENIGVLLGSASGGLVDVDLDAVEAVDAAAAFLPPTDRRHGRPGKPESHWWYKAEIPKTIRYKDIDGTCLVELRTNGAQTIVPPSIHPGGEALKWHAEGDPARVAPQELAASVARLAGCALLARHWPTSAGSRHELALALGGLLLRGGLKVDLACRLVEVAARVAGDLEWTDRGRAVRHTAAKLKVGQAVTAIPTFARLLPRGEALARLLQQWLPLVDHPPVVTGSSALQLERGSEAAPPPKPTFERPTIMVRPSIPAVVDEAVTALAAAPDVEIYQRATVLVRVERDRGRARKGIERAAGAPVIAPIPLPSLRELMARAANWVKMTESGPKPSLPPAWVSTTLAERTEWPLEHLEGVVEAPCLRQDGTILDKPGYDTATGLLYDPGSVVFPSIPSEPSEADAKQAIKELVDCFCDFLFLEGGKAADHPSTDRSAALALILTPLARHAIDGPIPLFAIRAPTAGTGKTLLADLVAVLTTGRTAARMVPGLNVEEDRKRILALGLEGAPLVLLDNVEGLLGSPALAAALTAPTFTDRLLGKNRMVTVRLEAVWIATGNNLAFQGDLGRRVVPIDLDPKVESPEERGGFEHPELLDWVRENRPRLVTAALTVLRAWVVAGRPQPALRRFGSFESWARTIRAALVWAGEPDPCGGRERIRETGDPDRDALRAALRAWSKAFGETGKTLREVVTEAESNVDLKAALGALDRKFDGRTLDSRRLGYAFRRFNGRIVHGLRLEPARGPTEAGVVWRVVAMDSSTPGDPDDPGDAPRTLNLLGEGGVMLVRESEGQERSPASPASPARGGPTEPAEVAYLRFAEDMLADALTDSHY